MVNQDDAADPEIVRFYAIVKASYTREEMHEFVLRTDLAVRVAKIRGLIPWDYDGDREDTQRRTTYRDVQGFDFPDPPTWGYGDAA
jgi:hypothetical protein